MCICILCVGWCQLQADEIAVIARQFGHEQQLEPHLVQTLIDFLQHERTKRL